MVADIVGGKMYQGRTGPHGIAGVRSKGQPAQISQDDRRMDQGSPSEVVVEIHPNSLMSEPGQASEVAPRAASRVEHDRPGRQQRGEPGERTATAVALKSAKASGLSE